MRWFSTMTYNQEEVQEQAASLAQGQQEESPYLLAMTDRMVIEAIATAL
jgi:hypothetical protein